MKQEKKQNILVLIDTLKAAVDYFLTNKGAVSDGLYQDSISCIELIGTILKQENLGEICETCRLCEIKIKSRSEDLIKNIEFLESQIEAIECKYEVLFLPYKADMWDSLDSIYQAASSDLRYHVTVMPIPYYNLDRSNGTRNMIYEGSRFPEELDIVNYENYSLESNCPDIIFIHNPYDEYNHVTTVENKFFSSNLIKYTKHLVYIPYYINSFDDTENKIMFNLPAIARSWKTFVQSEKIRNYYLEFGYRPNQIIAMGSPKIDYVIQESQRSAKIPEEWQNKILNKKIILFNTHIDNLINATTSLIERLHYIFSLVEQNDSIVLLWRPHPLSIETIKSMRPAFLNQYKDLVEEAKNQPGIIYDTTPELHRAIRISDAYMGDYSSLMALYGITGKPMMLLRPISKCRWKKYANFIAGVEYQDSVYFSASLFNGFFKVDLITDEIHYLGKFEKEKNMVTLHRKAYRYQNYCWFIPQYAEFLVKVDLDTLSMEYISLPLNFHDVEGKKIQNFIVQKEYLWLIPVNSEQMIRLNMQTEEMKVYSGWFNPAKMQINQVNFSAGAVVDGKIWLFVNALNKIIIIETETGNFEEFEWKYPCNAFVSMVYDGENLWFAPYNYDKIVKYHIKSKRVSEISVEDEGDLERYLDICYFDGYLWLIPWRAGHILKMNPIDESVTKVIIDIPNFDCDSIKSFGKFYRGIAGKDELIIPSFQANQLLRIEAKSHKILSSSIEISDELFYQCFNTLKYCEISSAWDEVIVVDDYPIRYFFDDVVKGNDELSEQRKAAFSLNIMNSDGTCGKKIWNYITNELDKEK